MKPIQLLNEENFAKDIRAVALPALDACRTEFTHSPAPGIELHCTLFRAENANKLVVISHGYTESGEKFSEVAWVFLQQGVSVLCYDHRGHGRSTREVSDPNTVYIHHFDDYVRDLASLANAVKKRLPEAQTMFLYGHSMGGGIAARTLELYPELFSKCVLNAPMIAPATDGLPLWLSKLMAGFFLLIGQGKKRFFGHKPYSPIEDFDTSCTTCRARFDYYSQLRRDKPEYRSCAAAYRWIWESLRNYDRLMRKKALKAIRTPTLILRAQLENSVRNEAIERFASAVPCAEMVEIPGVKHEIYRCKNSDLLPYFTRIFEFLGL